MRAGWPAFLVIAACGSKTPAPGGGGGNIGNAQDGGVVQQPNPDGCPYSFADLQANLACSVNVSCAYAEGQCYCGHPYPCSGVELPPDYFDGQPTTWVCNLTPPEVREDGCPGRRPDPDAACSQEGQQCSYGECCVEPFSCQRGHWVAGSASCPP